LAALLIAGVNNTEEKIFGGVVDTVEQFIAGSQIHEEKKLKSKLSCQTPFNRHGEKIIWKE
jgi:hypothetical protein